MFASIHDENKPVYTISIVAEIIGVHPRTLRIYEEKGLIKPQRTAKNTRLYSQKDVELIQEISELLSERHLNLPGVQALFEMAEHFHIELEMMIEELLQDEENE